MRVEKKVVSDLNLCYCVAPLTYRGERHYLVASEKEYACLLFDKHGNKVDTVWEGPGGTMSAVQAPGWDGVFLATHQFYSPNNSKEAKIVIAWPEDGAWKTRTLAELPCVHRFDILTRDGVNYLLACCLKSDYEGKDDWRFPGKTYACALPDDLMRLPEGWRPDMTVLKDDMLKNHGYSRDVHNGVMSGIVTCDTGVFRFTPPPRNGDWTVERLIADPVSDAVCVDFDGCGTKEILTLSPFHGDTLTVYGMTPEGYRKVFRYGEPVEFAHAICGAVILKKPSAVIGHRKGSRDLLLVSYDAAAGDYRVERIDHDVGPANVLHDVVDGKDILLAANREINEVAYYTLRD